MPVILTIDDETAIRDSFCNYLEDFDYQVLTAADGKTGIELIKQRQPDLVLCDLRMPQCDGLDVLQWIRNHSPDLPVIVVSGTGVVADVVEALKLGAWDYLLKPVRDLDMLLLAVERALEKSVLQHQAREYKLHLEQEVERRTKELSRANHELNIAATAFDTRDAIVITDPEGHIIRANTAMERLTGFSQQEMIGDSPRLWHSGMQSPEFYRRLWKSLLQEGTWQGELWNRSKSGQLYPVWQSISAVNDSKGRVRYYVGIATDLSELKAKERMLEHRACEERVLGGLAKLAMEHDDLQQFLSQSITLIQSQLDGLCLLSCAQYWNTTDKGYECLEVFAANPSDCAVDLQRLRSIHDQGSPSVIEHQDGRCLILPLGSPRRRLGVLVMHSELNSDAVMDDLLRRLCEVFTLALLHQETERELHFQANHDSLTELPNRQLLAALLEQQLSSAKRRQERGALLFLDLDNFKTLNDSLGHSIGDKLLQSLGGRIRALLRDEDILARLGGDEFVIVLPPRAFSEDECAKMASRVAEKIKQSMHSPFQLGEHEYQLGVSIGAAIYPEGGATTEELLKHADAAMYQAKAAGRNSVRFYEPELQQAADRRLYVERKLRRALELNELEPFFQPQLNAEGQVVGSEVLLRWRTAVDGWISPGEFIPVAEDTGLIIAISDWLLEEVLARMRRWSEAGRQPEHCHLSINVSPNQFYQPGFADAVLAMLARQQVDPSLVTLEITEGVVLRNLEDAIAIMAKLQRAGVRFSLDDFGTGYSSLAYLKKLPVNELKIDQSFIFEIDKDPDDVKIVDAILSLAGHFGLKVVAEGVETEQALALLQQRSCDCYQGFYFSRPLPEEEFLAFLEASMR